MENYIGQLQAIHTSDIVYKELRMPLTALQVSVKKLADTDRKSHLENGTIFTPYHARQFIELYKTPTDEQKSLIGIIRQQSKHIELIQHNLNSSVCAFAGCTLLLSGFLPQKLNPIVKPLLDSAKVCANHFTRDILSSAFCFGLQNIFFRIVFFNLLYFKDFCVMNIHRPSRSHIPRHFKFSTRLIALCWN